MCPTFPPGFYVPPVLPRRRWRKPRCFAPSGVWREYLVRGRHWGLWFWWHSPSRFWRRWRRSLSRHLFPRRGKARRCLLSLAAWLIVLAVILLVLGLASFSGAAPVPPLGGDAAASPPCRLAAATQLWRCSI